MGELSADTLIFPLEFVFTSCKLCPTAQGFWGSAGLLESYIQQGLSKPYQ